VLFGWDKMADHKIQHFLARSYLKGFSAGTIHGQHQIWILDKSTKEIHLGAIDKSAAFSFYYSIELPNGSRDNSVEESFSDLEKKFVEVVETLRKNIEATGIGRIVPTPTMEDRVTLCRYIFLHFVRIPANVEWIRQRSEKHLERMKQMGLLDFGESNLQNYKMKAFSYINDRVSDKAIGILSSKNVSIEWGVRRFASVFTCDNPVFRYNPVGANGITYEETNIFFPLYYRAYARLQGTGDQLRLEKHHDLTPIDEINQAVIYNASTEVYANDAERLQAAAKRAGISATIKRPEGIVFDGEQAAM
jgi:hypothetical protein